MNVKILYFAHLPERTGTREETLTVAAGTSAGELRKLLEEAHPKLAGALQSCRVAINEEFVQDATPLADGQTVAFIPPVSGG